MPEAGDPASAVLWNQSDKAICAYTLIWKYDRTDGWPRNPTPHNTRFMGIGNFPSLLLPFGLTVERRAFYNYWHTILPHSKRWLGGENVLGTNADVRPPTDDEKWVGGVVRVGGGRRHPGFDFDGVTLTIDAVFFTNGECAGADTRGLWDQIVLTAELHREVAALVRNGLNGGLDADRILSGVEQITGAFSGPPSRPPPPGPPGRAADPDLVRERARHYLAHRIGAMRTHSGVEKTITILNSWADAALPAYRRVP